MSFVLKKRSRGSSRQVPLTLIGGIRRDLNMFIPGNGLWTCDGFHTNDSGAIKKWPGFVKDNPTGLGARCDGLYQVNLAGTTYKIGMAGGIIKRVDVNPPTNILSGLTAGPVDAKVLGNYLFAVNGIEENKKIDSSLGASKMGIVAPTFTMTAADSAVAGVPNGDLSYKATYANTATGRESDPSPVSNTVTVASKKVTLTGFTASSDPQVDRIYIYRTVDGGNRWLFVDEINDTDLSYTDNTADADLAEEIADTNGVPPLAKYLEVYNGMLVLAGLASPNQSRVAFTGVLLPESHDVDDIYDLDPEEADGITGLAKLGNYIAAFKKQGLFLGQGDDPAFMNFSRTKVTQGCLSHWGIVPYQGGLYYPSAHGFYVFDGAQEHYVSEGIEPIYHGLELSPTVPISGIFYPALNSLMWACTTAGQTGTPDTLIIYNVKSREWTTRPLEAARLTTFLNSNGQTRMWVGHQDGRIWEGDIGNNDDEAAFTAVFVSRAGDLEERNVPSLNQFRNIHVLFDSVTGSSATVSVSYALDDPDGSYTLAGTFSPANGPSANFDIHGQGLRIFVKISVTSTEALTIRAVNVSGHPLGRYL